MSDNKTNNESSNTSTNMNEPVFDLSMLDALNALYEHDQIKTNSTTNPVNVAADKFDEVRIRLAQIDNYLIERNGAKIDPLKVDNVINMNTGKVVIKWVDFNGGVVRPEQFGYPSEGYLEDWKYFPEKDDKYPEKRTLNCYNHDKASDKEMLELVHAFIWSNGSNWCGMNYLPPIGSVVVVGFKKNNMPVILGYVSTNYNACKPFVKPGETIIKGYGNNYIHWRWSNKLDINVKSKKGEVDLDDPYKKQTYPNSVDMWMRFDCYTRNFLIDVNQTDGKVAKTTMEIKPEILKITSGNVTISVSNGDIYLDVGSSKIYIKEGQVSISSDRINLSDNSYINNSIAINKIRLDEALAPIKDNIETLNKETTKLDKETQKLDKETQKLNKETSKLDQDVKQLNKEISSLKSQISLLLSTITELASKGGE